MVTAFGDAFVLNSKRQFVHADEPAAQPIEYAYHINGWPRNIQLTSVRALKKKHACEWADMHSINGWVTSQLCGKPNDDPWHAWDITQASISGCYCLQTQKWVCEKEQRSGKRFDSQYTAAPNIIPSSKVVGTFEGVPLLAGGLDNAFVDTTNPDPYIVAGTWLVIGCQAKTDEKGKTRVSEWTEERRDAGVRWLISGNNKYHKQIVKKVSNPITEEEMQQALKDLELLGVEPSYTKRSSSKSKSKGWFTPARVRILGGYAETLATDLTKRTHRFHFYTPGQTPHRPDLYQHEQSAMFVYNEVKG